MLTYLGLQHIAHKTSPRGKHCVNDGSSVEKLYNITDFATVLADEEVVMLTDGRDVAGL